MTITESECEALERVRYALGTLRSGELQNCVAVSPVRRDAVPAAAIWDDLRILLDLAERAAVEPIPITELERVADEVISACKLPIHCRGTIISALAEVRGRAAGEPEVERLNADWNERYSRMLAEEERLTRQVQDLAELHLNARARIEELEKALQAITMWSPNGEQLCFRTADNVPMAMSRSKEKIVRSALYAAPDEVEPTQRCIFIRSGGNEWLVGIPDGWKLIPDSGEKHG